MARYYADIKNSLTRIDTEMVLTERTLARRKKTTSNLKLADNPMGGSDTNEFVPHSITTNGYTTFTGGIEWDEDVLQWQNSVQCFDDHQKITAVVFLYIKNTGPSDSRISFSVTNVSHQYQELWGGESFVSGNLTVGAQLQYLKIVRVAGGSKDNGHYGSEMSVQWAVGTAVG